MESCSPPPAPHRQSRGNRGESSRVTVRRSRLSFREGNEDRSSILPASSQAADAVTLKPVMRAVIYCRVSTKEQTQNLSLPTQLKGCRDYCRREGYAVAREFVEKGESAKSADRTELKALLAYCRENKGHVHALVVYNVTRFARDRYDHVVLRALLHKLGVTLRSVTEPIDDSSTGKLMEGVLAAFAQFDNDQKAERTEAGMRAALHLGRWTLRRLSAT